MPNEQFKPRPPKEASAFFKNKGLKPAFNWQDVWQEEHALNFSVAKATELDVLTSIQGAVQKALDEGRTFRDFKKELEPKLKELGWWGKKDVTDPLIGKTVTAQLGSPRRLRTIYDANMRTARAAGQFERAQRVKSALPFFIYELGPSKEHRKDHEHLAGTILPVDDKFWDTHMPPNGWGCKCRVRQITEREAESLGGETKRPKIATKEFTNKRTGEVLNVPADIDPGWASNPGKERMKNLDDFLAGKLEPVSQQQARAAVANMIDSFRFEGLFKGEAKGSVPVGVLPAARLEELGCSSRVVLFSESTTKGAAVAQQDYALVQHIMEHGECVGNTKNHLIFVGQDDAKNNWKAVIKKDKGGKELHLQEFNKYNLKQADS